MATDRSAKFWHEQIRNGQRYQKHHGGIKEWERYKYYYRHQWRKGVLPVNITFAILRSTVARVYFKNPTITVTPTRPGLKYQLHARLVESIDRWLLRELFTKYEIKKMIMDAFFAGTAFGFNGYDSEYGWAPEKAEGGGAASLTQFDKRGYKIEYNSFINPGMPWFLRARPDDVVWPWGTSDARSAEWVAMRVLRPLNDLKKDRKYTVPNDLQGSHTPIRTGPDGDAFTQESSDYYVNQDHAQQWIELWQVHDAKTGKIFGIAMKADKLLRSDPDMMQIEGLPVETLIFNPDPDFIYGIPDARIIEPQQLELNEIRTQAMHHRRVDLIKLLYKKGALDPAAIKKILDGDVLPAIEVNDEGALRDAVLPTAFGVGTILNDMAMSAELVRQDIRESVGFSRVQQGEFQGKTHVTKEEVQQVGASSDIRIDERKDAVVDLLTNIVRKFNQTIFKHWTLPQVRDIVGIDGAQWWLQFTGPEIAGEYNYKIDSSSAAPVSPERKKAEANQMAQAWAAMNQGQVKQGVPVPAEIQRYFFSQYEGIDVEKLINEQGLQQPGGTPQQAVPPEVAAAMMQRRQQGGQR